VKNERIFVQGTYKEWKKSIPRRLAWAKDIQKGQNVTFELDFVKIFMEHREEVVPYSFADMGSIEFAVVAESDNRSLMQRIHRIKTAGFFAILLCLSFVIYQSEKRRIEPVYCLLLGGLAALYLAFNYPSQVTSNLVPEEYFSDTNMINLNFAVYISMEVMMAFQVLREATHLSKQAKQYWYPAVMIGYIIMAYVRHAHLQDSAAWAVVYTEPDFRLPRQLYFSQYIRKAFIISSFPSFLLSLWTCYRDRKFSQAPLFLIYMMISFTQERYILATFSSYRFIRNTVVMVLSYMHLITWTGSANVVKNASTLPSQDEEDQVPISTTK